jgi:hypothetical protein
LHGDLKVERGKHDLVQEGVDAIEDDGDGGGEAIIEKALALLDECSGTALGIVAGDDA